MKQYFDQLRPMERRLVIGVAVAVFLVINWWQVWPHFSDWGDYSRRLDNARAKLGVYQTAAAQIPKLQAQVNAFESAGNVVALQDQSINLMRTIQAQASESGFGIQNFSRQLTRTNDVFFVEQVQNITVQATEEQLVDFLFKLGSGASMIRVRDLELQPDSPHYHLSANIKLVASYQKNSAAPGDVKKPTQAENAVIAMPAKNVNIFGGAKRETNSTVLKK
ncbi:MAG: type II secretion system protein GspM [Verrucomicrobiota bacterium]|jgi:Tfp pilus assembly protein PilO